VRQCLKARGMKPRQVGMIPAKADVDAQEACKKPGEPKPRPATAPSSAGMPPLVCVRPC
jgi:hypothetical protein